MGYGVLYYTKIVYIANLPNVSTLYAHIINHTYTYHTLYPLYIYTYIYRSNSYTHMSQANLNTHNMEIAGQVSINQQHKSSNLQQVRLTLTICI